MTFGEEESFGLGTGRDGEKYSIGFKRENRTHRRAVKHIHPAVTGEQHTTGYRQQMIVGRKELGQLLEQASFRHGFIQSIGSFKGEGEQPGIGQSDQTGGFALQAVELIEHTHMAEALEVENPRECGAPNKTIEVRPDRENRPVG